MTLSALAKSKSKSKSSFIRKIPGFRSGKPWKMVLASIGYFFLIIIIIALLVPSKQSSTGGTTTYNSNPPSLINEFVVLEKPSGDLQVQFSIAGVQGGYTYAEGDLTITITDNTGRDLYKHTKRITKSDFGTLTRTLTGAESYGYLDIISVYSIDKGYSNYGSAKLKIDTGEGVLTAENDFVSIPHYSDEEIEERLAARFRASAKEISMTRSCGDFQITLERAGFYTVQSYSGSEQMFRIDLAAKNADAQTADLYTYDAAIIQKGKQYKRDYGSEFDASDVHGGVTVNGYLLFDTPETLQGDMKIFIGKTYTEDYDEYECYFNIEYYLG